jgi:hypothetical protein
VVNAAVVGVGARTPARTHDWQSSITQSDLLDDSGAAGAYVDAADTAYAEAADAFLFEASNPLDSRRRSNAEASSSSGSSAGRAGAVANGVPRLLRPGGGAARQPAATAAATASHNGAVAPSGVAVVDAERVQLKNGAERPANGYAANGKANGKANGSAVHANGSSAAQRPAPGGGDHVELRGPHAVAAPSSGGPPAAASTATAGPAADPAPPELSRPAVGAAAGPAVQQAAARPSLSALLQSLQASVDQQQAAQAQRDGGAAPLGASGGPGARAGSRPKAPPLLMAAIARSTSHAELGRIAWAHGDDLNAAHVAAMLRLAASMHPHRQQQRTAGGAAAEGGRAQQGQGQAAQLQRRQQQGGQQGQAEGVAQPARPHGAAGAQQWDRELWNELCEKALYLCPTMRVCDVADVLHALAQVHRQPSSPEDVAAAAAATASRRGQAPSRPGGPRPRPGAPRAAAPRHEPAGAAPAARGRRRAGVRARGARLPSLQRDLADALVRAAEPLLAGGDTRPGDLARAACALGRLGVRPPQPWLETYFAASTPLLRSYSRGDLLATAYGLGRLRPGPALPCRWASEFYLVTQPQLRLLGVVELSNLLLGVSRGMPRTAAPSPAWLAELLEACAERFDAFDAPAYALVAHGLGRLRHRPGRLWAQEFLESAATLLDDFSAGEASLLLRGLALLGVPLGSAWLRDLWHHSRRALATATGAELANIGWALALLRVQPPPYWREEWCALLERATGDGQPMQQLQQPVGGGAAAGRRPAGPPGVEPPAASLDGALGPQGAGRGGAGALQQPREPGRKQLQQQQRPGPVLLSPVHAGRAAGALQSFRVANLQAWCRRLQARFPVPPVVPTVTAASAKDPGGLAALAGAGLGGPPRVPGGELDAEGGLAGLAGLALTWDEEELEQREAAAPSLAGLLPGDGGRNGDGATVAPLRAGRPLPADELLALGPRAAGVAAAPDPVGPAAPPPPVVRNAPRVLGDGSSSGPSAPGRRQWQPARPGGAPAAPSPGRTPLDALDLDDGDELASSISDILSGRLTRRSPLSDWD